MVNVSFVLIGFSIYSALDSIGLNAAQRIATAGLPHGEFRRTHRRQDRSVGQTELTAWQRRQRDVDLAMCPRFDELEERRLFAGGHRLHCRLTVPS